MATPWEYRRGPGARGAPNKTGVMIGRATDPAGNVFQERDMPDKPTVLVVDDEQRFRENLVKLLRAHGYKAMGACDGRQALAQLGAGPADVVLLDIKMPDMGGLEALAQIKSKYPPVEVIMLSGHASVDTAREIISLGGFDYLLKPHTTEDLLVKIDTAFEKKRDREKRESAKPPVTS